MTRVTFVAAAIAAITLVGARAASGQQRDAPVRTQLGIQQTPIASLVGDAPLVFSKAPGGEAPGPKSGNCASRCCRR